MQSLVTLQHPCTRAVPLPYTPQRRAAAVRVHAQQQLDDQPIYSAPSGGNSSLQVEDEMTHFISSLATLGLGATLLSERLNGVGVVRQLELWNKGLDPLIIFTIGSLVVAGLMPRKSSTAEDAVSSVQTLAGRVSFLGLAGTLAAELLTGKGLLALLHIDTGVELSEAEGILAFLVMLILTGPHKHTNPRT